MGFFRYFDAEAGQVGFELRSSANLTLLCGRVPVEQPARTEALERLRRRCADAEAFQLHGDADRWQFDVVDGEGRTIATSRTLASEALALATIKLTQLHGPQAALEPTPN